MRRTGLLKSRIFGLLAVFLLSISALPAMSQTIGSDGVVKSGDGVLNLRSGPSTSHEIWDAINNGTTVTLRETRGDWGRIEVCCATYPLEGWVYLPLVDFGENAIQEEHDRWVQERNQCPPTPHTAQNCTINFSSCDAYEDFQLMRNYAGFDLSKPAFYPYRLIDLTCEANETEILEFAEHPEAGMFGFKANESGEDVMYWFNLTSDDPAISRGTRIPSTHSNRSTSFFDYIFGDGTVGSSGIGTAPTQSTGGSTVYPTDYTLVCREKIDLNFDNWRKGPTYSCSGYSETCKDEFKAKLTAQYGSLNSACHVNHEPRFDYETIE